MVISQVLCVLFFLICFIVSVSALNFSFSYPTNVDSGETFEVVIEATTNDKYDVKITVLDGKEIISEIENDGWKNPYYYLKGVFPEESKYENRVIKGGGEMDICVRLRKTEKTSYDELCKKITVEKGESQTSKADEEEDEKVDVEDKNSENHNSNSELVYANRNEAKQKNISSEDASDEEEKVEQIVLNPAVISDGNGNSEYITKKSKVRSWMIYSFVLFVVAIIILIFFKKI